MTADIKAAIAMAQSKLHINGAYDNLAAAFLEVAAELEQERESHAQLQSRCYDQGGTFSNVFDELRMERKAREEADASANKWYTQAMTQSSAAEQRAADLQARLDRVEAERNAYRSFYIGVSDSFDDTWQCEGCGHAEPWWTDCNADYATRDAVLAISAEIARRQGKEAK